ncbi:MAG: hypothetical protein EB110_09220, partial [Betaproteobacteria bacterium]|nr:hypothetical protein [Betaproteobacteria bacterium]
MFFSVHLWGLGTFRFGIAGGTLGVHQQFIHDHDVANGDRHHCLFVLQHLVGARGHVEFRTCGVQRHGKLFHHPCLEHGGSGRFSFAGVFASFGAHPNFEVALERTLTELLQGRSFEGLNDLIPPTFNEFAVKEHNNIIDHFIDSTGVISWKFFSEKADYDFVDWNFSGTTEEEFNYLMGILKELEKEVYIADYEELGSKATRILVPGYSEIYLPEELIWDNHNKALSFREDILN